ncbi:MAG: molybdenum cofactor guanylyltransferase [Marinagarivorans sp.]|nr:molybdenum cofactor guanylyltransferase [Marinagarivorans sp.]
MISVNTHPSNPSIHHKVRCTAGLVLAGGQSTRMQGQNKALYQLHGQNLLQHSIDNLRKNLAPNSPMAIACGQHDYRELCRLPQLGDKGRSGPIAGIIAGLRWLQSLADIHFLAAIPCDAPFTPAHWIERLHYAIDRHQNCQAAYVSVEGRPHFAHSVWSIDALDALEQAYNSGQFALKTTLAKDQRHAR